MRVVFHNLIITFIFAATVALLSGCASGPTAIDGQAARLADHAIDQSTAIGEHAKIYDGKIAPYQARFGRSRPVIAVVGDNRITELSDYVVPYGILSQSGVADVMAVSTLAGPIKTTTDLGRPGFQIQSAATIAQFDVQFPVGADYVIVPATNDSPELLAWITEQIGKGATIVSICNGALVVAESGAMNGHYATAHWSSEQDRLETHAEIHWVKNTRFVADGNWVSSAGVSASIPTSIALVEAIAGHERAASLAAELKVDDWSAKHNSDAFQPQLGVNLLAFAETLYTNEWFHKVDQIGIPVATGVDEVALALTVDAYSSTGRSQAFVVAATDAPVRTRHGLVIIPDRLIAAGGFDLMLPTQSDIPTGKVIDQALDAIADKYGRTNASGVALVLEYPGFHD